MPETSARPSAMPEQDEDVAVSQRAPARDRERGEPDGEHEAADAKGGQLVGEQRGCGEAEIHGEAQDRCATPRLDGPVRRMYCQSHGGARRICWGCGALTSRHALCTVARVRRVLGLAGLVVGVACVAAAPAGAAKIDAEELFGADFYSESFNVDPDPDPVGGFVRCINGTKVFTGGAYMDEEGPPVQPGPAETTFVSELRPDEERRCVVRLGPRASRGRVSASGNGPLPAEGTAR